MSLQSDTDSKSAEVYQRRRSFSIQGIPQFVTDDIVRVEPRELYRSARIDRDRRLGLLVRRYVNQIQHGCQNRNCTVATCLSYRKRNNKGPLRHYTDLSARTLACHLVEEYSQAGKDPSQGLCQSTPVVPWYEDPGTHKTRRHRTKTSQHQHEAVNGHVPEDIKHQPSTTKEANLYSGDGSVNVQTSPGSGGQDMESGQRRPQRVHSDRLRNQSHTSGSESQRHEPIFSQGNAGDIEDQGNVVPPATMKKDLSSFVQSLWDTLALRRISGRSTYHDDKSVATTPASRLPDTQVEHPTNDPPPDERDLESGLELTNTTFCGFALRRLSWRSLTWLVNVHNEKHGNLGTPFEMFLKQSLHRSLSSPHRLHESAQSWNNDQDDEEDGDGQHRQDGTAVHHRQAAEESPTLLNNNAKAYDKAKTRLFDTHRSLEAFDMLATLNEGTDTLYAALHTTVQQCYTLGLPRRWSGSQQIGLKSLKRSGGGMRKMEASPEAPEQTLLGKSQVAEIFLSAIMASLMPLFSEDLADAGFDPIILGSVADMRNDSRAYPVVVFGSTVKEAEDVQLRQLLINIIDHFEDWHLLRLTTGLMDCLSHHLAAAAIRRTQRSPFLADKVPRNVIEIMLDRLCDGLPGVESGAEIEFRAIIGLGIVELARSVLLKEWDREAIVRRTGPVGGALELLAAVFRRNHAFYVGHSLFYMPFIAQAFDEMEMPVQWQSFRPNEKEMHILSCSFLFEPATLVKYFRSVNVNAMRRAHEAAATYSSDARQFLGNTLIPVYGGKEVLTAMRPHMAKYLVLTIRRSHLLEDAINQLWRRQRREILRPLRVRLGKDEGEDGLDHGGVQQEFFRLVFAEAFQPEYGMFTIDETTRMTWFQPGSMEPLYKFEALGILMSLAIYNAVTLPITLPLAFYRKLLGLKVKKLEHITDGWPDLAKGLNTLLEFEGDVADAISRTYEFSYEFAGLTVTVDMQKHARDDPWPPIERSSRKGKEKAKSASFELPVQLVITPPSQSPAMRPLSRTSSLKGITTPVSLESEADEDSVTVTNETREQYVKDYVFWLTDKSIRPQFEAFHRGFLTCLDPTALSMFTPEALREVMEGHRDINIDELERTATYEEYEKSSDYIRQFWQVVRSFSPDQHRQLLEFVTASDRVPVNGLESIQFIVQKNGDEDSRLPSSSTCYGRLLLPQYSTREILAEKLTKALENSLGFGSL